MKKLTISLLLGLLVFALIGCGNGTTTDPNATPVPIIDSSSGSENNSSEGTTPVATPTVLPTPTPEGNYVGFSHDSGFYDKIQEVSLTCNVEGAQIYYTLDGSTPDKTSTLYKEPIRVARKYTENVLSAQKNTSAGNSYLPDYSVDKCTVIRAVAYLPDGTSTPLAHATYFIGLDREKYGDVPIVSLITDFENLFDYETGIYVLGKTYDDWIAKDPSRQYLEGWQQIGNYSNSGRDWERPISVELITADGTIGFKQNMGVRIMGGASRNQTQKSLKLIAREEYGEKNLKYDLIPGNLRSDGTGTVTKYKSFVLRVGGNDADFARLRDPFLQTLAEGARFETQQSTPCVAFLNGEYWGLYSITEDYSDNYFENNYGIDNNNIVLIKCNEVEDGEEDDIALYRDMYLFITKNDMAEPAFYEAACEMIDMGSFIDYYAFQLYIANQDSIFENNNWRMWRVREADMATPWSDGKWRMIAYDSDYSTGIYDGSGAASTDNITSRITPSSDSERSDNIEHFVPIEMFRSLLANDEFRNQLILALCDMRNIYFEPKHAQEVLDEMSGPYLQLMPDTFKRFGPDWIAGQDRESYYEGKIKDLGSYMSQRYLSISNIMRKAFDLSSASKLTVSTEDASMGSIEINERPVDLTSTFGGMYFPETMVTVTAVPADGYKFIGWETKSDLVTDTTAQTLALNVSTPITMKAIFEAE